MDDLIVWLRGVLDEDEQRAQESLGALEGGAAGETLWRRMLADIEAKREISGWCGDPRLDGTSQTALKRKIGRILASAYRDRPGYRDEWRP